MDIKIDYWVLQDPVNPSETVIVIRSLVPGGVAQIDGRLVPGDRLIFVNDVNLENATLDEAVQALKGAQKGLVQIGVAKPLPLSGNFQDQTQLKDEQEVSFDLNPAYLCLISRQKVCYMFRYKFCIIVCGLTIS